MELCIWIDQFNQYIRISRKEKIFSKNFSDKNCMISWGKKDDALSSP